MSRIDRNLIIIVLLSVFAWAPLVNGLYFFKAHDAPHSVFFLIEFDQAIRDGAWYPRWGTDFALGYGYPLFNVYAPLAYYLAEGFALLGAGYVGAVKAVYALAVIGSGLSMYLFGRRAFSPLAGLVAGVVYMYIPYHLLDTYVRSAYAESVAFAFMPLTLWAFHGIIVDRNGSASGPRTTLYAIAGGLSYGALILTHNGTALVFTPLLLGYCVWLIVAHTGIAVRAWLRAALRMALAGGLALGLSAIFWLPLLVEAKYVQVDQWTNAAFDFTRHFVYFFQLFSPFWGYGYSGVGIKDDMSFQVGLAASVLAFLAAFLISRRGCPREVRWQGIFFILVVLALGFLMTGKSDWFWETVPAASLVQFPWRLLGLISVAISALAGIGFATGLSTLRGMLSEDHGEEGATAVLSVAPILLAIILASYGYLAPQYTEVKPVNVTPASVIEFETFSPADRVGATAWVKERPTTSPLVDQYRKGETLAKAVALTEGTQVEMIRHGGASEAIRVKSASAAKVMFYTYYFPGWRAYVDGKPADVYPTSPQALITLDVPRGEHLVTIRFEDTPARQIGEAISALTLLAILGLIFFRNKWSANRQA